MHGLLMLMTGPGGISYQTEMQKAWKRFMYHGNNRVQWASGLARPDIRCYTEVMIS